MKTRNHALDGLRGLAALAVVYDHTLTGLAVFLDGIKFTPLPSLASIDLLIPKIVLMVANGESAVALFFLLSGCVLRGSLERAFKEFSVPWAAIEFGVRRLLRLIPTTAAAVITVALICHQLHEVWPDVFRTFSLHHTLSNAALLSNSVIRATWTLAVERAAILPLLVAGAALVRLGEVGLIAVAVYCFAAAAFERTLPMPGSALRHAMPLFAFGLLVPGFVGEAASRVKYTGVVFMMFLVSQHLFEHQNLRGELVRDLLGFLLLCQVFHHGDEDWVVRFLNTPGAKFLGRISFSLYVWNAVLLYPFLDLAHKLWGPIMPDALAFGIVSGTVLALMTMPIADASERYIEKNSTRAGAYIASMIPKRRSFSAQAHPENRC